VFFTILAVFAHISFTAPDSLTHLATPVAGPAFFYSAPVTRYEFFRFNATRPRELATVYSNPATLTVLAPRPGGSHVDAFVSLTADPSNAFGWRHGGQALVMRACDFDTCSDLSNITIQATAMPVDTNVTDLNRVWKRTGSGLTVFNRAWGDTALSVYGTPGPLMIQETIQRARIVPLCETYHAWALRGVLQACP
jgi:hypothetical protein